MNPVFIDLETRSAADLKLVGGYAYAKHETTRLLTVAWQVDGEDHVWLPGLSTQPPEAFRALHLPAVQAHVGPDIPVALCRVARRPWVAHNCWTFDRPVWEDCTEGFPKVEWVDTYPLALRCGLPGRLDAIGKMLLGEGKYEQGKHELKKGFKATSLQDCDPENVPLMRQVMIAKYNVQDVRLLAQMWPIIRQDDRPTPMEQRVLAAHDAINDRGCRVDRPLVIQLIDLAESAKSDAIKRIAAMTDGGLPDKAAIQSRAKVLDWLDSQGFGQFKDKDGKKGLGLRKELITRFIETTRANLEDDEDESDDTPGYESGDVGSVDAETVARTVKVVNVLEARMQALRITGGKLDSALWSLDENHRARGLFAYWAAHTGRWGGRRIQVQNLQRPKEGVDAWAFLDMAYTAREYREHSEPFDFDHVKARLPIGATDANGDLLYPYLSVDDVAPGMMRGILLPDEGDILAAADLSNIEARVLDWCAGGHGLDVFWDFADPYMLMAEQIFGPREKWTQYPDPKKKGAFLPLKKHPYRQVGKVVVLGSGYQLGAAQFTVYAAANGINLAAVGASPEACILAYRRGHPHIAGEYMGQDPETGRHVFRGGLWSDLQKAVTTAVRDCVKTYAGNCTFHITRGNLICTLPSGRRLIYRDVRAVETDAPWGGKTWKVEYRSPRYGWKCLYGGAIAENIVQAISRDVQAEGLVRLEDHGKMPVVLHCHDEAVSSTRRPLFPEFMGRFTTCPEWLDRFPLDAEGGLMERYSKTVPGGRREELWRNGTFVKVA